MYKKVVASLAAILGIVLIAIVSISAAPIGKIARACPTYETYCMRMYVGALVRTEGLPKAARAVRALYDARPDFRSRCGTLMLVVGADIASTTRDPAMIEVTPETAVCNYGFFQQYPASLLMEGVAIDEVRSFCERVGDEIGAVVPDARAECFRGVGRGLPFVGRTQRVDPDTMSREALAVCARLAPARREYLDCIAGVFNEMARRSVRNESGLSVRGSDPMWLCDLQKGDVRDACEGNWKWTLVSMISTTSESQLQFETPSLHEGYGSYISRFGTDADGDAGQAVWALAYEQARIDVGHPDESVLANAAADCAALPHSLIARCVAGYSVGLAKHGTPWRQDPLLFDFCEAVRGASLETGACLEGSMRYLVGFYAPVDGARICEEARKRFRFTCPAGP